MKPRFVLAVLALVCAGSLTAAPKVVKKVPPEFPAEAVKKNITAGTVRAKVTIAPDGKVLEVEIVEAEPKRLFDKVSIEALKEWRFEPGSEKQVHEVKLVFRNDEE
jgi:periplasmic protein TonB